MIYHYDCEFIEDGTTIDLISIGVVAEDGRQYYAQNINCAFDKASDWVIRNVFPSLSHFNMRGHRDCSMAIGRSDSLLDANCYADDCPWRHRNQLKRELVEFCDPGKYGKPEFWGYYSAYDHIALCQIFGTMMDLPKGWPMLTYDIKQLCDDLGNPKLPEQGNGEHNALADARWNRQAYEFLMAMRNGNATYPVRLYEKVAQ